MWTTMKKLTNQNVILLPANAQPLFLFVSPYHVLELFISKFTQYLVIKDSSKTVAVNLTDFISCVMLCDVCPCLQLSKPKNFECIEEFLHSLPRQKKIYITRFVKMFISTLSPVIWDLYILGLSTIILNHMS